MQNIKQEKNMIFISFERPNNNNMKLYLKNEYDSICYEPVDEFSNFRIDLNEAIEVFKNYERNKIFLIIEESDKILTKQRNFKVNDNKTAVYNLSEVSDGDNILHPYITKNGYLHFSMNTYIPSKVYFSRRHIDLFKFNNKEALIEGQFSIVNSNLTKATIIIGTRFTERESEITLPTNSTGKNKMATTYNFSVDIYQNLIKFMKYPFET